MELTVEQLVKDLELDIELDCGELNNSSLQELATETAEIYEHVDRALMALSQLTGRLRRHPELALTADRVKAYLIGRLEEVLNGGVGGCPGNLTELFKAICELDTPQEDTE
jgi:hypothetical protein